MSSNSLRKREVDAHGSAPHASIAACIIGHANATVRTTRACGLAARRASVGPHVAGRPDLPHHRRGDCRRGRAKLPIRASRLENMLRI